MKIDEILTNFGKFRGKSMTFHAKPALIAQSGFQFSKFMIDYRSMSRIAMEKL
jgi:hypothetical protein